MDDNKDVDHVPGNSARSVLALDDDAEETESNIGNDSDDDDDDDDSADPLEAYVMEKGESMFADDDALEDSSVNDDDDEHPPPHKRRRVEADEAAGWLTNGSSSETENDEDEDDDEDDDMHVGFFSSTSTSNGKRPQQQLGPTGWIRSEVVNALTRLTNHLRKQRHRLADRVQLIKTARVPIIKVATCLGVEADIAVGGHNGTDTSAYAASLVQLFPR
jgi:hypothetical protein